MFMDCIPSNASIPIIVAFFVSPKAIGQWRLIDLGHFITRSQDERIAGLPYFHVLPSRCPKAEKSSLFCVLPITNPLQPGERQALHQSSHQPS